MDRFVEIRFQGKADQFFIVSYQILDSSSKVMERGEASLPACPELVANIRDWRAAYQADIRHARLEVVGSSITNSSEIDHYKLAHDLKKNLNNWLNSSEFLPIKDELIAKLSPDQVILVGIDVPDPILKYTPWHLWSFFEHFPKADFALLRPSFSRVNPRKNSHKSGLKILAIIGDSRSINTGEDETIIRSLPHIHDLKILGEPSKQKVKETLWGENSTDILFFAGHGRREKNQGKICINRYEGLSIEEIKSALRKRIQQGLQLAIFNSCDGLELGEEIADLHIPQTIVMKEAVPDEIAQRFLKDFLLEFSGGVPLVQALRQTRNKLKDKEYEYPYASWLPVLYYNPTEPLMRWYQPNLSQKYPWQTKLAASFLLGLAVLSNLGVAHQSSQMPVNQSNVISSEIKTTKPYEEKSYGIKLEYPTNWVLQEKFDSITGDVITLSPANNPEVELTLNIQDLSGHTLTLDQFKGKIVADLQKYSQSFTLLQTERITLNYKPGYKLTYTTTRQGIQYQAADIFAQKGNNAYLITYITPEPAKSLFINYQFEAEKIIDSLIIVN